MNILYSHNFLKLLKELKPKDSTIKRQLSKSFSQVYALYTNLHCSPNEV